MDERVRLVRKLDGNEVVRILKRDWPSLDLDSFSSAMLSLGLTPEMCGEVRYPGKYVEIPIRRPE